MPKPPKALIFDLDGVLIDSEPLHRRTWIEALAECGIQLRESDIAPFQGKTAEQVVHWLETRPEGLPHPFDPPSLILRKRELFRACMAEELQPILGAEEFLRRHKGRFPLGLVTSSALKTVGQVMLIMNWRNIFDALVGAEHVSQPKPHPEPFLHVANRFKLEPSDCLVFEDSAVGVQSALSAGARVCGVATTLPERELVALGASWTIRDFTDEPTLELALRGLRPNRLVAFFGRLMEK